MKKIITIVAVILFSNYLEAQDYKFGKVPLEEVTHNVYEKDTSASAVILYKYRNTFFEHDPSQGLVIVTKIHERIKILSKNGLDYATKKVSLYNSNSSKERLSSLKGYTFNEEAGKVKSEKLKKASVFKLKKNENWVEHSFTMPNAKVGSIVEWSYKITSPFWKIDDLIIQADIPTKHYFSKIEVLKYFNFQRMAKGGFNMQPKEYTENRNLSYSYNQSTSGGLTQTTKSDKIDVREYITEYDIKDIPALREESHVDNIDNYRYSITYELKSTDFPNRGYKQYSTTWEKVVETINKSDNFGKQFSKIKFLKEDAEMILAKSNGELEIMNNAFNHIKRKMTWNKKYGKYSRRNLSKAYKESTGDVSEINLTLVALLRECGLKANPVLVSTRSNGIPLFPTLEGFNYVIACIEINEQDILMDATEKNATPGILPERVLNWEGTLVTPENQYRKVRLYPAKASQRNTLLNVNIEEDGAISGSMSNSFSLLEALDYRGSYKGIDESSYLETLSSYYALDDISDFKAENIKELDKNIKESFDFERDEGAEVIGSDIYFSPLFFLALDENPFKLEDRKYPINYSYPRVQRKIINIKIPEGYKVTSLPKPIRIKLPDNFGSFLFNITEVEGGINVMSNFKINSAVIPSYSYAELKEFYNQRILKEAEKVVITKQ